MAGRLKKSKVVAKTNNNRLVITFVGMVSKKELDELYTDTRFCVADLQPGFDVLSDFSECKLIYLNGLPTFRKIMNYVLTSGVGEIVRIMHEKRLISRQIVNLALRVQGYKPIYVSTLEEAVAKLTTSVKRNGIRFHLHRPSVGYTIDTTKGEGRILNISTSGCAVVSETLQPDTVDIEILLVFTFETDDADSHVFTIKARIVRVESHVFAAEFINLEEERKDQLWKCLVYESQRDI